MAPKVLVTGSTGYVGGTLLDTLVTQHPEYDVTAFLRNVPNNFTKLYPNVHIVRGDDDDFDVLSEAASKADIVLHNGNSDHEPSLKALIAGLLRRSSSTPAFLIHLSGTGVVADWQTNPEYLGKLNPKIWSDVDDLDEITSRPDGERHRNTEKIVLAAGIEHEDELKTAILCPPVIYGPGRGPGRRRSIFFPVYWAEIKKAGASFYAGAGENRRSWVHIEDLMVVYLRLVEAAVGGGEGTDWGREGYYFASTQETSQLEIAMATGRILEAHGQLPSAEPTQLSLDAVSNMLSGSSAKNLGAYIFASNCRTTPDRAYKLFGYGSKAPSLWDTMEADLLACIDQ